MTYLMLTYVSEAGAAAYDDMTTEQREVDRVEHVKWFEQNGPALREAMTRFWRVVLLAWCGLSAPKRGCERLLW